MHLHDDSFNATCRLQYVTDNTLTVTGLLTNWTIIGGPHGCMCIPGYEFISKNGHFNVKV